MNATLPEMATTDYSWVFNSIIFWIGIIGGISGVIAFITIFLTRPRSNQSIEDDYYHFGRKTRITIYNLDIAYANNPLFKKFKLFSYDGDGKYEVSGAVTKLPSNIYEERPESGLNKDCLKEVWITEKFLLKRNRASKLKVYLENDKVGYYELISHKIEQDRIIITNRNDIPVRYYKLPVSSSIFKRRGVDSLRDDARIDDVFKEDGSWYIVIKEVGGRKNDRDETVEIHLS